ncbi:TetR/AcrR family transcriptional regulator [Rhodococcus sp. NM-2]|uniref:TetR/AcrR family transcriptional regulator n=1 Tax=Rhodococcus sp. NM-2 TaxID=3401174 RepID=UPI003AAC299A
MNVELLVQNRDSKTFSALPPRVSDSVNVEAASQSDQQTRVRSLAVAQTPPSPRVRLQVDTRRAQILEAARRLFAERPYSEVSTTELAEAAGVTRANLHYHFGTKRQLYVEVVQQFTRLPPPPDENLEGLSGDDRINLIITQWLDGVWKSRGTFLTVFRSGVVGSDPEIEEILETSREVWAARLTEILPFSAGAQQPEVLALVRAYQAMAEEACVEWLRRDRLTREQIHLLLRQSLVTILDQIAPAAIELKNNSGKVRGKVRGK